MNEIWLPMAASRAPTSLAESVIAWSVDRLWRSAATSTSGTCSTAAVLSGFGGPPDRCLGAASRTP
ncbi:hypothetical protein [Alloactinosynnema sp. L-07]|uniref:hypothetical protein n=1 Tax=Alloactinosynnema sp. L-07 TaxID=1653480 RepID=UPI0012F81AEB|nr:hypothetical protein [Alloactinosynnema sp. L-07]